MSLINDMLSDLEQRRGGHAPTNERVLKDVQVVSPLITAGQSGTVKRLFGSMALGVAAACAAWYGLQMMNGVALIDRTPGTVRDVSLEADGLPHSASHTEVTVSVNEAIPEEAATAPISIAPEQAREAAVVAEHPPPLPDEPSSVVLAPVATSTGDDGGQRDQETLATTLMTSESAMDVPVPVERKGTLTLDEVATIQTPQHQFDDLLRRSAATSQWLDELKAFTEQHEQFTAAKYTYAQALMRAKRDAEAEVVLRSGLAKTPGDPRLIDLLAHLLVNRGEVHSALALLSTMPAAHRDGDTNAFVAALEQRLGNHDGAISAYRQALNISPARGVWWVGLGISLTAAKRDGQAEQAFRRALGDRQLSDKLRQFAKAQIGRLGRNT